MAKLNTWALKRPERRVGTRRFSDPDQPGAEIELTLRALDIPAAARAMEVADGYIREYVTGDEESEANAFPSPTGEPVDLTAALCRDLAVLEAMQDVPEGERYTFVDLVGLMLTMPGAFQEINAWAVELGKSEEARGKRSRGAATAE